MMQIPQTEVVGINRSTNKAFDIPIKFYPDGAPRVDMTDLVDQVELLVLRPQSLATFMAAMFLVDGITARGKTPGLVLPFIPGARQDRLNPTGDFLFTAKSIAKELNARAFPFVYVLDAHSDVSLALIENVVPTNMGPVTQDVVYAGVIAPDGGAIKRALLIAQALEVPLFHAWKKRNVTNGLLSGFGIEPLPDPTGCYLMADDICDGGGTFLGLAEVIKAQYPESHLELLISHGLFTQGQEGVDKLLKSFDTVYTTDSTVGQKPNNVRVLGITGHMINMACVDSLFPNFS